MKYYIIAGEASGDLHGSHLISAIKQEDSNAEFRFWGGDKMESVSGEKAVKHIRDLSFMGIAEVVSNLGKILSNFSTCKNDIIAFHPDAIILIDYSGFNLRIAKWSNKRGFKNFYYISPQIWAWRSYRVHQIISNTEQVYSILPFEKGFYKDYGYDIRYVGHPLIDIIPQKSLDDSTSNQIALLPGSRKQEIKRMLPVMLEMTNQLSEYPFIIAAAPSIPIEYYQSFLDDYPRVHIIQGSTYDVLKSSKLAVVTSGTATLEAGLIGTPQIVCYKGSSFSYQIAKRLVKVKYISLVNLILDEPLVTELIQDDFNKNRLFEEMSKLLNDDTAIKKGYERLRQDLDRGGAAKLATQDIKKMLS